MITLTGSTDATQTIDQGGEYFLDLQGNFGSGNIAIELSMNSGSSYSPITTDVGTDLSVTGDYNAVLTLPAKSIVKFNPTSVTSVVARLVQVRSGS